MGPRLPVLLPQSVPLSHSTQWRWQLEGGAELLVKPNLPAAQQSPTGHRHQKKSAEGVAERPGEPKLAPAVLLTPEVTNGTGPKVTLNVLAVFSLGLLLEQNWTLHLLTTIKSIQGAIGVLAKCQSKLSRSCRWDSVISAIQTCYSIGGESGVYRPYKHSISISIKVYLPGRPSPGADMAILKNLKLWCVLASATGAAVSTLRWTL